MAGFVYDFGMVGRIDDDTRLKLVRLYLGLIEETYASSKCIDRFGTLEPSVNRYILKGVEVHLQIAHGQQVDRMEVKALIDLTDRR